MPASECDIAVIGGGIAGVSIAAHLSALASVRLFEMEDQPSFHSTGRSAALFSETYGNPTIQALTRASRDFCFTPPADFCAAALVKPRSVLTIARTDQADALDELLRSAESWDRIEHKSVAEAVALHPLLKTAELYGAALRNGPADIDVNELLQGYLRLFRARGGEIVTASPVTRLERDGDAWIVGTPDAAVRSTIVVNAAGAWAGGVAKLAGASDIGLQPLRRTAMLLAPPPGVSVEAWPMLLDVDEQFYLKPDAGQFLLSPADETPSPACDAQPEELDIAVAIDRLERATTLQVRRVAHKWAGLRSFVVDRSPVVGFDPVQPGFFWLAALGGYGIQTAPALSRFAASLALRQPLDPDLAELSLSAETISPRRPMPTAAAG